MKQLACLLVPLAALVTSAHGNPKPEPTDPKLAQLVGRWEGKGSLTLRGAKIEMTSTFHCQRAVVGPPLVCGMISVAGDRRLEEVQLLGYDKASDTYHLFTVNNWGEAYDHAGRWTQPQTATFVHAGTRDGKPLRETYTYEVRGDTLTTKGAISVDGKVFAEGVFSLKRIP